MASDYLGPSVHRVIRNPIPLMEVEQSMTLLLLPKPCLYLELNWYSLSFNLLFLLWICFWKQDLRVVHWYLLIVCVLSLLMLRWLSQRYASLAYLLLSCTLNGWLLLTRIGNALIQERNIGLRYQLIRLSKIIIHCILLRHSSSSLRCPVHCVVLATTILIHQVNIVILNANSWGRIFIPTHSIKPISQQRG